MSVARRSAACTALALALLALAGCSKSSNGAPSASTAAAVNTGGPAALTSGATTPPGPAPAPAPITSQGLASGSFEFLTYNVAGLPPFVARTNPAVNTPLISPKLNRYDLAVVQEDFWYHASLISQASHPHQSPPQQGQTAFLNDGLNRFSRFPFANLERVTWNVFHGFVTNSADGLASKGFSAARHELAPGVELLVINLHGDAGKDAGDADARLQQYAQLATWIQTHAPGEAVIVAGDTNLHTPTVPRDQTTFNDFLGTVGLTHSADALGIPFKKLDRVLFRSGPRLTLQATAWRIGDEFKDAAGDRLSDHDPIHVTFSWQQR